MQKEMETLNKAVADRFKNMTASKKLNLSLNLYSSARELKKAAIKQFHPELEDYQIERKVREIFIYART